MIRTDLGKQRVENYPALTHQLDTCTLHVVSSLSQNVHVLLPKPMVKVLGRLAAKQKVSVAELIRQAVEKTYSPVQTADKKQAFSWLSKQGELWVESWSKMKKDLLRRYE